MPRPEIVAGDLAQIRVDVRRIDHLAGELATAGRFSSAAEGKRKIVRAVEAVARRLGNTKAVCRKSYIHPAIFDAYLEGARIAATEPAIVATIRRRLRAA